MNHRIEIPIFLSFILMLFIAPSCKQVIEEDISKKTVLLISPSDNDTNDFSSQTFVWEKMDLEKAPQYNFQVASPSFANVQKLLVDTTLKTAQITRSLPPGTYQWRVRADNGTYRTEYSTRSIVVDSSSDLGKQAVLLSSPLNKSTIKDTNVSIKWDALLQADSYRLQIVENSFDAPGEVILDQTLLTNGALIKLSKKKQKYAWRVKGMNLKTSTPFSTPWEFTIDTTSTSARMR